MLNALYNDYREKFKGFEIVVGEGNLSPKVLLIGEAPGKDEVRLGRPFVGAAGKNLNKFLEILRLSREEVFITNAIKYRLSKVNPKTSRLLNRPALASEIESNRDYLYREIQILKPIVIVTLGNVPLKAVLSDMSVQIGAMHGKLVTVDVLGDEYNLFPLYHPASVIYNRDLKEVYLKDLEALREVSTPD